MALVKSILFIDGENLTLRYQDMKKSGRNPKDGIIHIPDVFVWHNDICKLWGLGLDFYRILFYSSVVGSDDKVREVKDSISKQYFPADLGVSTNYFGDIQVIPLIFKKEAKSNKSRLVDINITIDSMRFSLNDAADVLCFISGDGDFLSLYSELMRNGKKVSVAALSSGLSKPITYSVDKFISLDDVFFTTS